jgi:TonB family protein
MRAVGYAEEAPMRWLIGFLSLGILFAQDARDLLNQGVQAFRNARYPEAVQAFQKAVELDPSFGAARLYLATAYMQQYIPGAESPENTEMARKALEQFQRVLDLEPNNNVATASIASLYLNQRNWDEAQRWYERVATTNPKDAFYALGFIAWSRCYSAIQQARQNSGMQPADPGPIWNAALREDLKSNWSATIEDGIADMKKTLAIDPQYSDAMTYINLFLRMRADLRDNGKDSLLDVAEADRWMQSALQARQQRAAQAGGGVGQGGIGGIRFESRAPEVPLVRRVEPVYPQQAVQSRISGVVRLTVTINKDGTVQDIKVISGHPLFVPPAIEAVKQWVYRPTLVNGAPVETTTQANVEFRLPQ